jgi:hypothetical protein
MVQNKIYPTELISRGLNAVRAVGAARPRREDNERATLWKTNNKVIGQLTYSVLYESHEITQKPYLYI